MGTLESQLFSWDAWAENGPMDFQFYNVVLKVPIGEFSVGTKFDCAFLSGETSTLQLCKEDGTYHEFELKLSPGPLIQIKK